MKKLLLISLLTFITSCSGKHFTVSKIVDGNTIELSNGITVTLDKVENSQENMKILDRYLKGNILLYDETNEEITDFTSDHLTAMVYNSDGDCVNNLLSGVTEITNDKIRDVDDGSSSSGKTVVKFSQENGVLEIPVIINNIEMYFIFDTGAGLISISQAVADDLYDKGKLKDSDFIGNGQFSDANGDITIGTIINLSTVTIGNRELINVQACVTRGQNAPLLLGQSALQKFGKVSIDYSTNEIIFE